MYFLVRQFTPRRTLLCHAIKDSMDHDPRQHKSDLKNRNG